MKRNFCDIEDQNLRYDYCIVGAGVAGIICANELRKKFPDKTICIIESGDKSLKNAHNKTLKDLDSTGIKIKRWSREFAIGGTSHTWGGVTAMLNRHVFEPRAFLQTKGWPIAFDDLKPYYDYASEHYDFIQTEKFEWDADALDHNFAKHSFAAYLRPVNYRDYLDENTCDILINAHVTGLSSEQQEIKSLKIRSQLCEDKELSVHADVFILTMGAIETIKLLLNAHAQGKLGLGAEEQFLGRYFMNHPKNNYGTLRLNNAHTDMISSYVGSAQDGIMKYQGLSLSRTDQHAHALLNSYVKFLPVAPWEDDYYVSKLIHFLKNTPALMKAFLKLQKGKTVQILGQAETGDKDDLQNSVRHNPLKTFLNFLHYLRFRLLNQSPKITTYSIRNFMEMEPRIKNAVTLGKNKDRFGNYNVHVQCELSETDKQTVIKLHSALRDFFKSQDIGHIHSDLEREADWPIHLDASHHMGGTICGSDASHSVVDRNLKIHSQKNLYIIGGSVFPVSDSANPTWTIAALACRFADHL